MSTSFRWLCIAAVLASAGVANAADLFSVTFTVGPSTGTVGFNTAQQTFDGLSEPNLKALVPSYTGSEVASMGIDYRGLAMKAVFPIVGNPQLDLTIPGVGIAQSFVGATREQSRQLLRTYFKNGDALGRIMQALAQTSPVDPIAGNPSSLESHIVSGSYDRHFRLLAGALAGQSLGMDPKPLAGRPVRLAAAGTGMPALGAQADDLSTRAWGMAEIDLARFSGGGLSSTVVSLPFGYALPIGADRPLSIDGELQQATTQGARTWAGNVGLSYRLRMASDWYLVPSANVGATAARDLGAAGTIVSGALTSAYRLVERADYVLWMGNAANLLQTLSTSVGEYRFDPRVRNLVFTNGLVLWLTPAPLWQGHWLELSFRDTRYTGTDVYDQRYDQLGVALVRARRSGGGPATLRAELNYLDTTHSRGWGLKFQATF